MSEEIKIPYVLELKDPVQFGSNPEDLVTEITFERGLTAGDLFEFPAEGAKLGDSFKLIAKMASVSIGFVKKMSPTDAIAASKVVNHFLPQDQGA